MRAHSLPLQKTQHLQQLAKNTATPGPKDLRLHSASLVTSTYMHIHSHRNNYQEQKLLIKSIIWVYKIHNKIILKN